MKVIISLVAAHFIVFIVTYGHAYQQVGSTYAGENIVGALVTSLFWPLYWSVQVWK